MNLLQVIRAIEAAAAGQPAVASIVRNDVYRLNSIPTAKYGVFAWLQGEHRSDIDGSLIRYAFTFFYVDRLVDGGRNEVQVQSQGIEVLENILQTLAASGIMADEHYFRSFNERFHDECAGVFCTVGLEVPKDALCDFDYNISNDVIIY